MRGAPPLTSFHADAGAMVVRRVSSSLEVCGWGCLLPRRPPPKAASNLGGRDDAVRYGLRAEGAETSPRMSREDPGGQGFSAPRGERAPHHCRHLTFLRLGYYDALLTGRPEGCGALIKKGTSPKAVEGGSYAVVHAGLAPRGRQEFGRESRDDPLKHVPRRHLHHGAGTGRAPSGLVVPQASTASATKLPSGSRFLGPRSSSPPLISIGAARTKAAHRLAHPQAGDFRHDLETGHSALECHVSTLDP